MNLPSELISQFVKVTRNKKEKNERNVYGTIVEKDGERYVRLDGSNELTPVRDHRNRTVDTSDGDRVLVMIKNHTAIVTGNIKHPAARSKDVEIINRNWEAASKTATDHILKTENGVTFGDFTSEDEDVDVDVNVQAKTFRYYIKSVNEVFKPYYEYGDTIEVDWLGTGYVSDSGVKVNFSISLAKPVIGNPNVTIIPVRNLEIRQNGVLSTHSQPIYSATLTCDGGMINVIATISSIADTDHPCGIAAGISIAFS